MKRTAIALSLLCAASVAVTSVDAQDVPELVTDRPDQTESSSTVPAGWTQIETGVFHEKDDIRSAFSYPTTLVRYGLLDALELRATGEYAYERYRGEGSDYVNQGIAGLSLGLKAAIAEESELIPETALIAHLGLPLGSRYFRPEKVAPSFRFSFSKSLSDVIGLGLNLGGEWDGSGTPGTGIYTLALGVDFAERWGGYVEAFGDVQSGRPPAHLLDGGLTFQPSGNIQLDASFAIPLTEGGPDYYAGTGVSWRLPQ